MGGEIVQRRTSISLDGVVMRTDQDPDYMLPIGLRMGDGFFSEIAQVDPILDQMTSPPSLGLSTAKDWEEIEARYNVEYGGDDVFAAIYDIGNLIQFPDALNILHRRLNTVVVGVEGTVSVLPEVFERELIAKSMWNETYCAYFGIDDSIEGGLKQVKRIPEEGRGGFYQLSAFGHSMLDLLVKSKISFNERIDMAYMKGLASSYYIKWFSPFALTQEKIAEKLIPHIYDHKPYDLAT